jgi:hypothetical protein
LEAQVNRLVSIAMLSSLVAMGTALGQSARQTTLAFKAGNALVGWDTSLPGKWTYRSYLNRADVIVNADPDKAVQALSAIYGSQVTNAAAALTAFNLIFGEGTMTFDPSQGNTITGNFDMGGGYVLDLKGTMQTSPAGDITIEVFGTGRPGTKTDNWEYDYRAATTPKWSNGVNQVPALVGTVIRAKPHDGGAAGVVASFIAIKQ